MAEERKLRGFSIFGFNDEVQINRLGRKVIVKGRDGSNAESETVEANLLYEILKQLKRS